jgi:ABC-type sugar transport system ATPase subunit
MDILLQNITKSYNKNKVVDDFCLTIPNGKLTSLLGPSGCGKTTLLNIIAGVIQPNSGEVFFGEQCVTACSVQHRNVGYVFQNYSLYPTMSVYDNIKFPLTNIRYPQMSRKEKKLWIDGEIRKIASMLKIQTLLDRAPDELSGGQKQRVAIARALVRKPQILLMDEPFANLDRKLCIAMREEIRSLQQALGITTVFVTHNQSDANAISDEIVLMNEGKIQQAGFAQELYSSPNNLFVADFFGNYDINKLNGTYQNGCFVSDDIHLTVASNFPNVTTIAFRPEDAYICPPDTADFTARVLSVVHEGKSILYTLKKDDTILLAYFDADISIGQDVSIALKRDKLLFFDKNGNRISL